MEDSRRRFWIPFAIAILLRICWAAFVPVVPVSDSSAYVTFARNLLDHGVFGFKADQPFAFWPPGTSFIYAGVFALPGDSLSWVVPANILMTLGIMWSATRIARRLYSADAAVWTAWILALWPSLVVYATIVASELPFVLLTTFAIDVWTSSDARSLRGAVLAGVCLGAAALVRPLALVFPVLLATPSVLVALRSRKPMSRPIWRLAACVIVMFIIVLPWTARNAQLYDRPVLISTNGGTTFWMGNTPGTRGGYMEVPAELRELNDADVETILRARAWEYIRREPLEFVLRSLRKGVNLYATETIGIWWNEPGITKAFGKEMLLPLKISTQIGWLCILIAAGNGLWQMLRKGPVVDQLLSPVVLPIAALTFIHAVTVSQDRYHLGFCSLIAILAGIGGSAWHLQWNSRKRRP